LSDDMKHIGGEREKGRGITTLRGWEVAGGAEHQQKSSHLLEERKWPINTKKNESSSRLKGSREPKKIRRTKGNGRLPKKNENCEQILGGDARETACLIRRGVRPAERKEEGADLKNVREEQAISRGDQLSENQKEPRGIQSQHRKKLPPTQRGSR